MEGYREKEAEGERQGWRSNLKKCFNLNNDFDDTGLLLRHTQHASNAHKFTASPLQFVLLK